MHQQLKDVHNPIVASFTGKTDQIMNCCVQAGGLLVLRFVDHNGPTFCINYLTSTADVFSKF